jgi:hypothetical protein
MSLLSFAARKWFTAAVTIVRRCDGRIWNVRHTKFLNLIRAFPANEESRDLALFCVQIEIDLCSAWSVPRNEQPGSARLALWLP